MGPDPWAARVRWPGLLGVTLLAGLLVGASTSAYPQSATDSSQSQLTSLMGSPWPDGLEGCWIDDIGPGQQVPVRLETVGACYEGTTWHPNAYELGTQLRLGLLAVPEEGLWRITSDPFDLAMLEAILDQILRDFPETAESIPRMRSVLPDVEREGMWMTIEVPEGGSEPIGRSWYGPHFPAAYTSPDGEPGVAEMDTALIDQVAVENRFIFRGPLDYRPIALYLSPVGDSSRSLAPVSADSSAQIVLVTEGGCVRASLTHAMRAQVLIDGTAGRRTVTLTESEPLSGIFVSQPLNVAELTASGTLLSVGLLNGRHSVQVDVLEEGQQGNAVDTTSLLERAGTFSFEEREPQATAESFIPPGEVTAELGSIENLPSCPGGPASPHLVLDGEGHGAYTASVDPFDDSAPPANEADHFDEGDYSTVGPEGDFGQVLPFMGIPSLQRLDPLWPYGDPLGEKSCLDNLEADADTTRLLARMSPEGFLPAPSFTDLWGDDIDKTPPGAPGAVPVPSGAGMITLLVAGQPGQAIPFQGLRVTRAEPAALEIEAEAFEPGEKAKVTVRNGGPKTAKDVRLIIDGADLRQTFEYPEEDDDFSDSCTLAQNRVSTNREAFVCTIGALKPGAERLFAFTTKPVAAVARDLTISLNSTSFDPQSMQFYWTAAPEAWTLTPVEPR